MGGTLKLQNSKCVLSCKKNCRKFVKCEGGNILLEGLKGGVSYGPRKDFKDTYLVKKENYGCFVVFDGDSNDNVNSILPRDGKYIL